jgi:hypothetical protein
MSQHESNDRATAVFTPIPTKEELWDQAERQKRAEQKALEQGGGHEANVIKATTFEPFGLLRAQSDFIKAQVRFQHDIRPLVQAQHTMVEAMERAVYAVDYSKMAGLQESYIEMLTKSLESLGAL